MLYFFTVSRFPAGQQLVTKLVTAPMACGAVMVPTSMFMGQVVTAYNPFSGQQVGTNQHRRTVACDRRCAICMHVGADT